MAEGDGPVNPIAFLMLYAAVFAAIHVAIEVVRRRWLRESGDLPQRIRERLDDAYDVEPTQDDARRQIAQGFRPDGAHDFDPELEPGLRVVELDRLEQLWRVS